MTLLEVRSDYLIQICYAVPHTRGAVRYVQNYESSTGEAYNHKVTKQNYT